jgi:hypothetical protein
MTSGVTDTGRVAAIDRIAGATLGSGFRAVILLAGSVRATELSRGVERSLLDLPIAGGETVLSQWHAQVAALATRLEIPSLPVRVIINRTGAVPRPVAPTARTTLSIEQERSEYRGTGGVLRDVAECYGEHERVLVANAAQVLTGSLVEIASELLADDADISLVAHDDGTPSGLVMVRCGVLTAIRPSGFVDFKEQVLPRLAAAGRSIRVFRRSRPTGIPVRTLDGYLSGLRAHTRLRSGRSAVHDPFDEDWSPTFSLVEDGAHVAPRATIHDSVVLAGGRVGSGAVVVRSVVCPGGMVRPGDTVADQIVASSARERRVA